MAEEGGGGHGDSGSCSAAGSAQRQPPPPPPQAPQPGSQAPAAPALAPDHLPQNNTLVALPIVAIENILSFMSYDEISQLRLVRPPRRPGPVPRGTPASVSPGPRSGEGRRRRRVPGEGAPAILGGRARAAERGAAAPAARLPGGGGLGWGGVGERGVLAPPPARDAPTGPARSNGVGLGARRPAEQGFPRGGRQPALTYRPVPLPGFPGSTPPPSR